ncbi:MAG TPA: hypothetical protein VG053_11310 [Solirubrobacteraceae bacterium]|nr:hypothetical protein [Solirubrobacteraceae bacterium]
MLIYIALGAADLLLMLRYARKGLDPDEDGPDGASSAAPPTTPAMSY